MRASSSSQFLRIESGPREVDELENAHRVLARGLEVDAVHAVLIHDDHLSWLHLTHESGMDRVEGAGLRRDHMGRLSGQRYIADAERPKAERITQRDQPVRCDDPAGVGADHAREAAADHLFPGLAVRALDEAGHDLGVERRSRTSRPPLASWTYAALRRSRGCRCARSLQDQVAGDGKAAGARSRRGSRRWSSSECAPAPGSSPGPCPGWWLAKTPAPPGPSHGVRAPMRHPRLRFQPTPGPDAAVRKGRSR